MGLFKSLGAKRKDKAVTKDPIRYAQQGSYGRRGVDWTAALPAPVLTKIFTFVCPHTQDMSYESCELSAEEDACMLCNLRDLSYCVRVCRRWRKCAVLVLYGPPPVPPQFESLHVFSADRATKPDIRVFELMRSITASAKRSSLRSASVAPFSTATPNLRTPHERACVCYAVCYATTHRVWAV